MSEQPNNNSFPPPGYVEHDEAARMFGVTPGTFKQWRTWKIIRCGERAVAPDGRRCTIYPLAGLEQDRLERERAKREREANRPVIPQGFVDMDGAARMFGITVVTLNCWQREGKFPQGQWGRSRTNKPCRIFAVTELERAMERMRASDEPFWDPQMNEYQLPAGMVRMQDAYRMFGVDMATWQRWEREGVISCGRRTGPGGFKIYPLEELKRMLEECGKYSEPYPDPARPGVYRIPLSGRDIHRREAIIDEADLPLVQGRKWHWSDHGPDQAGQVLNSIPGPKAGIPIQIRLRQVIMGVRGIKSRVGHRNGDPLDCRRSNLFVRNKQEQSRGGGKHRTMYGIPCSSRFKGVCWCKRTKTWLVSIKIDSKQKYLGSFHDEFAAGERYDEAAQEFFGEYAKLNFPDGVDAWLEQHAGEESDPPQAQAA